MKPPAIIELALTKIVMYERNSNVHSVAQIERLTKSIKEFGFLVPCVVKTRPDGKFDLAAGHGRIVAAKRAGLKSVPVVVADHLSPTQFKAFVIADNKLAEMGEWDMNLLKAELSELRLDGFDVEALGFDADEADRLLGVIAGDNGGDDGGGAGDDGSEGEEKKLQTNIAYNIIFDTDAQQQTWFSFLRYLKAEVEGESIGARLRVFISEGDFALD